MWEVRVFAGRDASGKPKQVSKTVRGSKRDAEREAARLTLAPQRQPGSHSASELLDEWIEVKAAGWAAYTLREYRSRANRIKLDPIGSKKVAALKVSDIGRWVARLGEDGVGESAIRNRHSVLRPALQQTVRWEWIGVNPASNAPFKRPERIQRSAMTDADVLLCSRLRPRSTSGVIWPCACRPKRVLVAASWQRCAGMRSLVIV